MFPLYFGLKRLSESPPSIFRKYSYPTLPSPNFYYILLVLKESRDPSFNRSGGGISPASPKTTPLLLDLHELDHGGQVFSIFFFFFFILNAKIYNNILPITLPTKLLYDTTKTLPGGAICHDYPLAFNINLKKGEKKNTSKYTTKYKMLNIRRKLFYKQILKPVSH